MVIRTNEGYQGGRTPAERVAYGGGSSSGSSDSSDKEIAEPTSSSSSGSFVIKPGMKAKDLIMLQRSQGLSNAQLNQVAKESLQLRQTSQTRTASKTSSGGISFAQQPENVVKEKVITINAGMRGGDLLALQREHNLSNREIQQVATTSQNLTQQKKMVIDLLQKQGKTVQVDKDGGLIITTPAKQIVTQPSQSQITKSKTIETNPFPIKSKVNDLISLLPLKAQARISDINAELTKRLNYAYGIVKEQRRSGKKISKDAIELENAGEISAFKSGTQQVWGTVVSHAYTIPIGVLTAIVFEATLLGGLAIAPTLVRAVAPTLIGVAAGTYGLEVEDRIKKEGAISGITQTVMELGSFEIGSASTRKAVNSLLADGVVANQATLRNMASQVNKIKNTKSRQSVMKKLRNGFNIFKRQSKGMQFKETGIQGVTEVIGARKLQPKVITLRFPVSARVETLITVANQRISSARKVVFDAAVQAGLKVQGVTNKIKQPVRIIKNQIRGDISKLKRELTELSAPVRKQVQRTIALLQSAERQVSTFVKTKKTEGIKKVMNELDRIESSRIVIKAIGTQIKASRAMSKAAKEIQTKIKTPIDKLVKLTKSEINKIGSAGKKVVIDARKKVLDTLVKLFIKKRVDTIELKFLDVKVSNRIKLSFRRRFKKNVKDSDLLKLDEKDFIQKLNLFFEQTETQKLLTGPKARKVKQIVRKQGKVQRKLFSKESMSNSLTIINKKTNQQIKVLLDAPVQLAEFFELFTYKTIKNIQEVLTTAKKRRFDVTKKITITKEKPVRVIGDRKRFFDVFGIRSEFAFKDYLYINDPKILFENTATQMIRRLNIIKLFNKSGKIDVKKLSRLSAKDRKIIRKRIRSKQFIPESILENLKPETAIEKAVSARLGRTPKTKLASFFETNLKELGDKLIVLTNVAKKAQMKREGRVLRTKKRRRVKAQIKKGLFNRSKTLKEKLLLMSKRKRKKFRKTMMEVKGVKTAKKMREEMLRNLPEGWVIILKKPNISPVKKVKVLIDIGKQSAARETKIVKSIGNDLKKIESNSGSQKTILIQRTKQKIKTAKGSVKNSDKAYQRIVKESKVGMKQEQILISKQKKVLKNLDSAINKQANKLRSSILGLGVVSAIAQASGSKSSQAIQQAFDNDVISVVEPIVKRITIQDTLTLQDTLTTQEQLKDTLTITDVVTILPPLTLLKFLKVPPATTLRPPKIKTSVPDERINYAWGRYHGKKPRKFTYLPDLFSLVFGIRATGSEKARLLQPGRIFTGTEIRKVV